MKTSEKLILIKDLIQQALNEPNVLKKASPQEISVLKDFLDNKASVAQARKVLSAIERRTPSTD